MKPVHLILAAAALVILVLFWRQSNLEGELATVRTTLENQIENRNTSGRTERRASAEDLNPSAFPSRDATSPGTDSAGSDALAKAEARIADLERVVNGQADVLEGILMESNRQAEQRRRATMRAWGPEQAVGSPDTMTSGDQRTAWAPASADGGVEWLEAEFENATDLAQIIVRQTCNPGCITKVVAVTDSGAEVPIWEGVDPSKGQALADTPFASPGSITARRVKVYLDTSKKPGWEEIDALQLVGRDGSRQWAKSVNASSTYAGGSLNALGGDLPLDGSTLLEYRSLAVPDSDALQVWSLREMTTRKTQSR